MTHPLVTIGLPVFNGRPHLESTLGSLLGQSLRDFELVIFDNASTDDTSQVCRAAEARDPRVRYFRNPSNLGAAENYNLPLRYARGRYFKWNSANDLCHPEFLSSCVAELEADPDAVLAYPETVLFTTDPEAGQPYQEMLGLDDDDPVTRFIRFLERVRLNNVMNGVCRLEALRAVPPIKSYVGSDLVTTAALTLHGKFRMVSGRYFYRRVDERSSTRVAGADAVRRHYDPSGKKWLVLQTWRMHLEYMAAVTRAPLTIRQKIVLEAHLLRRMMWARGELLGEATSACRRLIRGGRA